MAGSREDAHQHGDEDGSRSEWEDENTLVPNTVFLYSPLIPRLSRMFKNPLLAESCLIRGAYFLLKN